MKYHFFCSCWGSNPGPWAHKTHALPTELHERKKIVCILGDSNPRSFTQENLSLPPLTTRERMHRDKNANDQVFPSQYNKQCYLYANL